MFLEKIKDDDFGKTFDRSIPDKSISDMNISGQELRLDKAQSPIEDSEKYPSSGITVTGDSGNRRIGYRLKRSRI